MFERGRRQPRVGAADGEEVRGKLYSPRAGYRVFFSLYFLVAGLSFKFWLNFRDFGTNPFEVNLHGCKIHTQIIVLLKKYSSAKTMPKISKISHFRRYVFHLLSE
jgi:hypothetical protein